MRPSLAELGSSKKDGEGGFIFLLKLREQGPTKIFDSQFDHDHELVTNFLLLETLFFTTTAMPLNRENL